MRIRFMFWLDLKKDDEYALAEEIATLKDQRSFTRTVRDGIRLICSLQRGNLDILEQLFPWVWEQIALQIEKQHQTPAQNPQPAVPHIQAQLDRMEQILLHQGAIPVERGKPSESAIPEPDTLDFELEIKSTGNTENNHAGWNFMLASAIQVYGNYDALPPQVIEYGVRTGRIPPEKAPKPVSRAQKSPPGTSSSILSPGPKTMDVPQFNAPVFDDALIDNLFG